MLSTTSNPLVCNSVAIERCREMKLRAAGADRQLQTDFLILLTAKTVHSLYSPLRRQWVAL